MYLNKITYKTVFILLLVLSRQSLPAQQAGQPNTALDLLERVGQNLDRLHYADYDYRREISYPSSDYHHELSGHVHLDFNSTDTLIKAQYYFENTQVILAFNGSESFACDKVTREINIDHTPTRSALQSFSFLNPSLLTLRQSLPWIKKEAVISEDVRDTVLHGIDAHIVLFALHSHTLDITGTPSPLSDDILIRYRLLVDKKSALPLALEQQNNKNTDRIIAYFDHLVPDRPLANEAALYYSSYLKNYHPADSSTKPRLIRAGAAAPAWRLPNLRNKSLVDAHATAGQLVLLNFWICHCGYCIAELPELKALQQKYGGADFHLYAINPDDSPETIRRFNGRMGTPPYDILYNGEEVRRKYGVSGFPTAVLIDRDGRVLYSGPWDLQTISRLIEKNRK